MQYTNSFCRLLGFEGWIKDQGNPNQVRILKTIRNIGHNRTVDEQISKIGSGYVKDWFGPEQIILVQDWFGRRTMPAGINVQ